MDPLSIIASSAAIYGLTTSLVSSILEFCASARHVDIVVEDLKNDILTLERAVSSIEQQAEAASQNQSNNGNDDDLWLDARQALDESLATLQSMSSELGAEVGAVGLNSSNRIGSRVMKTFRLNIRNNGIQRLRGRIRWNQSTLQVVLETIIM